MNDTYRIFKVRKISFCVTLTLMIVLSSFFNSGCTRQEQPDNDWLNNAVLTFGISDSIDNQHFVVNLDMNGKAEVNYNNGENKRNFTYTLSKGQVDTLKMMIQEYNNNYMSSVHKYERGFPQNNPKIYTDHFYEDFRVMKITSEIITIDTPIESILCPTIMYMHLGNRMCYVVGDVFFYGESEGKFELYRKLNRFMFKILQDVLREHGVESKYADLQWPQKSA